MTQTLITKSAWDLVSNEVSFFADEHNSEAAMYPLFGFLRRPSCIKMPWEILTHDDIEYFIVTHVWIIPREYTRHSKFHANFHFDSPEQKQHMLDTRFHPWHKPITQRLPQLETGFIHSHQFTSRPTPSDIDLSRVERLARKLGQRNLSIVPEVIIGKSKIAEKRWSMFSFAVDSQKTVTCLGTACVVPDDNHLVQKLLIPPYHKRKFGMLWEWMQVKYAQFPTSALNCEFGWRAFETQTSEHCFLYIAIPPWSHLTTELYVCTLDTEQRIWSTAKKLIYDQPLFQTNIRKVVSSLLENNTHE